MESEADSSKPMEYWRIVEEVVRSRGRSLQRYSFFEEVWKAVDEDNQLIIVKAPTGSGKTEAASTPFISDLRSGNRRWLSLIHVLPTRSLVNSMRWRYAGVIESLKVDNAVISYEYGQLTGIKPHLDGDIVVTTYDTMLHRFYGVGLRDPHLIGQISKLMNSLLIMDEVQLLQDEYWYAMNLLPYHIAALLNYGIQIILMTATLPSAILAMIKERIGESRRASSTERPAVIIPSNRPARGRLSLDLKNEKLPSAQDELIQLIREHYPGNGSILIIANTVEKAASIYISLLRAYARGSIDLKPLLLHSRLRQGVRRRIEELLESKRDERMILVATQVVEAGLDLDSTLLLTEISPIDSLIQRIGRCGRRRDGHVIIYTESEGALKVYPRTLIERTREAVTGNEDLLANSPADLESAQMLLDQVFDPETIKLLKGNLERAQAVIEWIKKYWIIEHSLDSWIAHIPPDQLLRLGVEIPSYKPRTNEEYERLLKGKASRVGVWDLEENLVRLTAKDTGESRLTIPALLHETDDGLHYLILELKNGGATGEIELIPYKLPAEKTYHKHLLELVEGRRIFLLNPAFYEKIVLDDLESELGVIKPWKRM